MRVVADSSLLLRLYLHNSHSESIERFLAEDAKVVSLSALARVEVLNVLLRQEKRADQFLADLDEGLRLRLEPVEWPKVFQQAESLARRFSPTLRPICVNLFSPKGNPPALPEDSQSLTVPGVWGRGQIPVFPGETLVGGMVLAK